VVIMLNDNDDGNNNNDDGGGGGDDDNNNDMETKVFSSGDKTMHFTGCLWCSATKIFFGH